MKTVSAKELLKLLEGGGVLVVDVREHDWQEGYIKGSYNIPFNLFPEQGLKNVRGLLCQQHSIVVHCHYSQTRGPQAAQMISEQPWAQPLDISVLKGGWEAWFSEYGLDHPYTIKL